MKKHIFAFAAVLLAACTVANGEPGRVTPPDRQAASPAPTSVMTDAAILAGGCFWCVESDFEKLDGVIEVISGYSGGELQNPTYGNHEGHREVAKIIFDPAKISYDELLDYYWRHVDPTDSGGQFCDRGHAYTTAIFARPDQIGIAQESKAGIEKAKPFDAPIVTPVLPAGTFWTAEDYHQDYYRKNPLKYKFYRTGCGRDRAIRKLWDKKS